MPRLNYDAQDTMELLDEVWGFIDYFPEDENPNLDLCMDCWEVAGLGPDEDCEHPPYDEVLDYSCYVCWKVHGEDTILTGHDD